jgi:hypothetical protein
MKIRTGESQDTCRSVEMRGVSPSRGERLFARSLYFKAVLRSGVLPRMEWERPTSSTKRRDQSVRTDL